LNFRRYSRSRFNWSFGLFLNQKEKRKGIIWKIEPISTKTLNMNDAKIFEKSMVLVTKSPNNEKKFWGKTLPQMILPFALGSKTKNI